HDPEALRQIALKSRSKVLHLGLMDEKAMRSYLSDCHRRGELSKLMPALKEGGWYDLAIEVSGLLAQDALVESVSAYQEKVVASEQVTHVEPDEVVSTEVNGAELPERESRVWWPIIKSTLVAVFIALTSALVVVAVAGALHPPLWASLEKALLPIYQQLLTAIGV
ncbi:MAG: hypothetical protein VW842_09055, partial [Halieaceae bacterium]